MSKFVPNSFMVANAFVDHAMNKISDASCKVYLVIVRKTRGWTKECDALSLTQLEELTRKSRPTVVKCCNELVRVGLVKKHDQSKYGNVYSLLDNYDIGELFKFPSKKYLLVKEFTLFKNELVNNFNYPSKRTGYDQLIGDIYINFPSKKSLLVKSFNQTSKNILPLLVKIFNTQNTTIKRHYQNNKNDWIDFKILKSQITSINTNVNAENIINASWLNLEILAFEDFNKDRNHSDQMKLFFLGQWLIRAYYKYEKLNKPHQQSKSLTDQQGSNEVKFASINQLYMFANKLAHLPEVSSKFSSPGETYEKLAGRIAAKLSDPKERQSFKPYLDQLGFKSKVKRAVA
ncbi:replication protein [Acinetobacter sp. CE-15]|uniref:replication protein n=1 Tax=Acinetobacter sp. CE-15 TaxID=3425693 RepID=UPI003DA686C5